MKSLLTSTLTLITVFLYAQQDFSFSIHFASGSHDLSNKATLSLNRIAGHINLLEIDSALLKGHTDPHGDIAYNRALSKRRVESVYNYLKHFKMKCHFIPSYYGEEKLLTKKKTEFADSLNRRVEIFYTKVVKENPEDLYLYGIEKKDPGSIIYQFDPNTRIDTTIFFKNLDKTCIDKKAQKNHLIVMDWTRSVYAYGTSMIGWYKRNSAQTNFKHIVLFNDGNKKSTSRKKIGKTGGIYTSSLDSLADVLMLMEKVASKGTGGDYPENVIEALLFAQKEFPEVDTLVLLADNEACIRDYRLTHLLNKPVKIIVNQVNPIDKIVNYQFFSIAAHTKGSVYLNEEEYHNLRFKNNLGPKPIIKKDTLVVLGKQKKLSYKEAVKANNKKRRQISVIDERPTLLIDETAYVSGTQEIGAGNYSTGAMSCMTYEYFLYNHVRFKEEFTGKQKFQKTVSKCWKAVCKPFKKKSRISRGKSRKRIHSSSSKIYKEITQ